MGMKTMKRSTTTPRSEFLAGVRGELPILVGTIPFGLIYGVSAIGAGIPAPLAQAMSLIIFAGSAQFATAQLYAASLPGLVIVITGAIINLRHLLYSASVAPYTRRLPTRWKLPLAYLLTDEAYAVTISHYRETSDETPHRHWFYLGAGLALWSTWQASTAVGILLGAQVPASWSLDFALPLTFIALVVPAIKDRASLGVALVAGIVAILAVALPLKSGIIAATLAALAAGIALESLMSRRGHGQGAAEQPGNIDTLAAEKEEQIL
ncbi:MAG: AzlC-like protein [Ktedonobacterales bacterium]|jgi:4-azaleucine resistance transporter AzlC|nr:MAG: AzlC-like protein [Ktedonobacterales bacterium]